MPTVKIEDSGPCQDPEHIHHFDWYQKEPGLYQHTCPRCGNVYRFRVEAPTTRVRRGL